ncbi:hypothetical protein [Victivallis vadensis]|uniref:hypothetical protein n=1 Tax=Victivallis vadensis TaxID=172901 RepID=UPI00307FC0FC
MSEPPTCLIPQNAQTPFDCWNLPDEGNRIFWHPELNIPAKGLTLMTGEGDLTALAFDIACRCMNLNLGKLLYLRSDNFPEHSPFPAFLTKCLPAPWGVINIKFSTDLQYWPLDLSGIPPQRNFMWLVMSSKKMIWKRWPYATSNTRSSLEANLDLCAKAGNKFTFLILEGQVNFEEKPDFYATMKRLNNSGMTVLIVTSRPPRGISRNAIWDTVITMRKWRAHHCGKHRLVADIRTRTGKRNCQVRYQEYGNFWVCIPDKRDLLREPVREMMAAGLNAKQIVAAINARYQGLNRPLTESALAAMKRFWGFRTYRPEKKPRTKRTVQRNVGASDFR